MNLYFKNPEKLNETVFVNENCFCITDRLKHITTICEESQIIDKINKNEDGYFDFSKNLIDVGAEDGNYAILLNFKENYCFEPNKHMCCLIYTNMFLRNKVNNIQVYNFGCGEREEIVNFNGFAQEGSGYFIQSNNRLLDKSYQQMHKVTLDSFGFKNIGLLKTDTEGFDIEVLKGAVNTIKENNYPPILFELWDIGVLQMTKEKHDELENFIRSLGYDIIWHWGDHETHLAIHK